MLVAASSAPAPGPHPNKRGANVHFALDAIARDDAKSAGAAPPNPQLPRTHTRKSNLPPTRSPSSAEEALRLVDHAHAFGHFGRRGVQARLRAEG